MRIALTKLAAQEASERDFIQALKALRLGLLCYGVLSDDELQAMYLRHLMDDDEVQFLLEHGFVTEDFRPVPKERLLQAEEIRQLNHRFGDVIKYWDDAMKASTKLHWLQEARKHIDLPNARRLLDLVKEAGAC